MGKEDMVPTHNGIPLSHKKEWNFAVCGKMDEVGVTPLSEKSQTEKDKYYMKSLTGGNRKQKIHMNLFTKLPTDRENELEATMGDIVRDKLEMGLIYTHYCT